MDQQQQKAPKDIRAVADYLRSSKSGMKTRIGVLNGKRVDYFKGTCPDSQPHESFLIMIIIAKANLR